MPLLAQSIVSGLSQGLTLTLNLLYVPTIEVLKSKNRLCRTPFVNSSNVHSILPER